MGVGLEKGLWLGWGRGGGGRCLGIVWGMGVCRRMGWGNGAGNLGQGSISTRENQWDALSVKFNPTDLTLPKKPNFEKVTLSIIPAG